MRIGIVTVPDSANFGSFLQAYALKIILNGMGHEVRFIATRDQTYVRNIYYNWKPKLRNLKHPVRFVKQNRNGYKKYGLFLADHKKIVIDDEYQQGQYDLILLGSDEIWNVCTEVFRRPIFYGQDMHPVIAYAVSAGKALYEDFQKYPEIMAQIKNIRHICARDENTKSIVEHITQKECPLVCDPTFLVDWKVLEEDYDDEYLKNNKYILIYLYPGSVSKESINAIKRFANQNGLKLVAAGLYNDWCDYNVICDCDAVLQCHSKGGVYYYGNIPRNDFFCLK